MTVSEGSFESASAKTRLDFWTVPGAVPPGAVLPGAVPPGAVPPGAVAGALPASMELSRLLAHVEQVPF